MNYVISLASHDAQSAPLFSPSRTAQTNIPAGPREKKCIHNIRTAET
jgi:hypothetical protein